MENNVANVEFKLIDSEDVYPDDLKPGEAILFEYPDKTLGLILSCPSCGKAGSSVTGNHKYNPETKSITPSLDNKCCGWHGHLTNGKFI